MTKILKNWIGKKNRKHSQRERTRANIVAAPIWKPGAFPSRGRTSTEANVADFGPKLFTFSTSIFLCFPLPAGPPYNLSRLFQTFVFRFSYIFHSSSFSLFPFGPLKTQSKPSKKICVPGRKGFLFSLTNCTRNRAKNKRNFFF